MRAALQQFYWHATATLASAKPTRRLHIASRKLIVCEGERQQQGAASTSQPTVPLPSAAAPSVRTRPAPYSREPMPANELEIKSVEKLGESRFSGVVALDSGETPNDWGRVALLATGDAAMLLLFVAIGRMNHGESISLPALLGTAWPFMAGWFPAAALFGGYSKDAQGGSTGAAAAAAAKSWVLGIPAGLLVRTASRGYLPEPTFMAVSMAVTGVLLVGWRSALAAVMPAAPQPKSRAEALKARTDRKGGPLEMFQMLFSMVKRW